MNNLQIFDNLKKGLKYKLALIGLSATLTATMTSGCIKTNKKTYSLESTVEALHKEEDLTEVDEYLLDNKIGELDKKFIEAYKKQDIDKCNKIIGKMSYIIIKALVAEGYGLEIEKIKDFDVIGQFVQGYNGDTGEHNTIGEYGIEFEYEGKKYRFEAERTVTNELGRRLCVIYRASQNYELVGKDEYTDFDYFKLPKAYEILKKCLATRLCSDNEEHVNIIGNDNGYIFDGNIFLEKDPKKAKAIKHHKKEKILLLPEEETPNRLPKKK